MANLITDWRTAVVNQLSANLPTGSPYPSGGWTVQSGERDGRSADRNLCVVFAPTMQSDSGNVDFSRPVLLVRAWLKYPKQPRVAIPRDPAPIEQLMIDLQTTLAAVQKLPAVGLSGLFFFITQIKPDYEDFGVEATLQGWTGNPMFPGG